MRNQRNFRGQSGRTTQRPLPMGGARQSDINCCCQMSEIDDVTGQVSTYFRYCKGTVHEGNPADCSCCGSLKGKYKRPDVASALFGG